MMKVPVFPQWLIAFPFLPSEFCYACKQLGNLLSLCREIAGARDI
jgi:hypothetical protein